MAGRPQIEGRGNLNRREFFSLLNPNRLGAAINELKARTDLQLLPPSEEHRLSGVRFNMPFFEDGQRAQITLDGFSQQDALYIKNRLDNLWHISARSLLGMATGAGALAVTRTVDRGKIPQKPPFRVTRREFLYLLVGTGLGLGGASVIAALSRNRRGSDSQGASAALPSECLALVDAAGQLPQTIEECRSILTERHSIVTPFGTVFGNAQETEQGPRFTITTSPTSTPDSSNTPTPTRTPEPTMTIIPTDIPSYFTPSEWASNPETHLVDPDVMFPIVGEVSEKIPGTDSYSVEPKRRTIDLEYKSLKLAVILGKEVDLQDPGFSSDPDGLRGFIAGQLDQQEELKQQLEEVSYQLSRHERANAVVVISGEDLAKDSAEFSSPAKIFQIAIRNKLPISKRYLFENGKIRQMTKEEVPLLMPPLSSQGSRFIRTDTGESVMLRGAKLPHFYWLPTEVEMEQIKGLLEGLKSMGGDYLVIGWNSGFAGDPEWNEKLIRVLQLAKNKLGFRVQLDLDQRGLEPGSRTKGLPIEKLDSQITEDWAKLLSNSETAFWINRTVDILSVVSEPSKNSQGNAGEFYTSFFDPVQTETAQTIRLSLNNSNAIIAYSGGKWGWGGDAIELLGKTFPDHEFTIAIHPYRLDVPFGVRPDFTTYSHSLQEQGFNIAVSEFGWRDWKMNPQYVYDSLKYMEENKISYAIFGLAGGYNPESHEAGDAGLIFIDYEGRQLSPVGVYLKDFWSQFKD